MGQCKDYSRGGPADLAFERLIILLLLSMRTLNVIARPTCSDIPTKVRDILANPWVPTVIKKQRIFEFVFKQDISMTRISFRHVSLTVLLSSPLSSSPSRAGACHARPERLASFPGTSKSPSASTMQP